MFLQIPLNLANDHELKNISKIVYGYIFSYRKTFESFPTVKQIANDLNRSEKTISRSITELRKNGYIKTYRTGSSNIVDFLPIDKQSVSEVK